MKDGFWTRVSQKGKKVLCLYALFLCGLSVAGTLTCYATEVLTQLLPHLAILWNYSFEQRIEMLKVIKNTCKIFEKLPCITLHVQHSKQLTLTKAFKTLMPNYTSHVYKSQNRRPQKHHLAPGLVDLVFPLS